MTEAPSLRGTWTALVTPFTDPTAGGSPAVDFGALDALVERQIAGGVEGVVPCGTTGESPTLSHSEHDQVVERVVATVAGRVPVIAGSGSNSTAEALRLTRHAAEAGADAALVVCPYYNRPSQRMLYEHFALIARASAIPLVLYNVPSRTGVNLEPETVARLFDDCPNVVAVKEAAGSVDQVSRIKELCAIDVLSGDDSLTLPMISVGAVGVISVASNAVPDLVSAAVRAALDGGGMAEHARLYPLYRAVFTEPNPVPVKCALRLLGHGNGVVRRPLLAALPETESRLRNVLAGLGLV